MFTDLFPYFFLMLKYIFYYYLIMFSLKLIRQYLFNSKKSIMIILGSGGHTGEMLLMLRKLDYNKFSNCYLVSSHNDKNSETTAKESLQLSKFGNTKFHFIKIYRARNVGQSFISSIPTTLYALLQSFYIFVRHF